MGEATFRVVLTIDKISNAPFNHSRLFVKWKTPQHESQGCTSIAEVRDHTCLWADVVTFDVKLKIDKSNTLRSHMLRFSVREASPTRGTEDFKRLGIAEFDLAAVARLRESFHRVLLQKTKATEALHFSIKMQQLSGAPTFHCPSAPQEVQDVSSHTTTRASVPSTPVRQTAGSDPMAEVLRQSQVTPSLGRDASLLHSPVDGTPISAASKAHRRGPSTEVVVDSVFAAVFGDGAGQAEGAEPEPQAAADSER